MKLKPTKQELQECIVNAMTRLIKEGKSMKDEKDWGRGDNRNFSKKSPKHQKMKPQGKQKYKNNWENDNF
jgi:hypothetical protein